jgi:cytochrome c biogenesis protein CcdA/thiol-disulfide isomerase/thioredoxin
MGLVLVFAFIAGVLTILSPCMLPVVPLLLGGASAGGRRRVLGLLLGFAAMFVAVTVVLASALAAAGLTTDRLRLVSALLLGAFGAVLVIPALGRWLEARAAPLTRLGTSLAGLARGATSTGDAPRSGFAGGVVVGGAIGLIWAPCVGPIMAGVIAVAVTSGPSLQTLAIALAYVGGAAIPLALVAGAGRAAVQGLGRPERRARLQRIFGAAMVVAALVVATGLDVPLQTSVSDLLPDGWGTALLAVEQQPAVQDELGELGTGAGVTAGPVTDANGNPLPTPVASSLPGSVALQDLGPAPELAGITDWINSAPLTLASLRGKVVLVQFWTFACINCIHVQPYVKAWYDRYADDGFVVIGVHTPELSFEREIANVRKAVADDGVRFPVAFDPRYATWNAYHNSYWPAFYFIDKQGTIRHTHWGEGDYAGSEQVIRELLAAPA